MSRHVFPDAVAVGMFNWSVRSDLSGVSTGSPLGSVAQSEIADSGLSLRELPGTSSSGSASRQVSEELVSVEGGGPSGFVQDLSCEECGNSYCEINLLNDRWLCLDCALPALPTAEDPYGVTKDEGLRTKDQGLRTKTKVKETAYVEGEKMLSTPPQCEMDELLQDRDIVPVVIELGPLPLNATPLMVAISQDIKLRFGKRLAVEDNRPLPYSVSLPVNAGFTKHKMAAWRAIERLVDSGVMEYVGTYGELSKPRDKISEPRTKMYLPPIGEGADPFMEFRALKPVNEVVDDHMMIPTKLAPIGDDATTVGDRTSHASYFSK